MNIAQLQSILQAKENDYFRGCLDTSSKDYIHDQQINAAKEIVLKLGNNGLRSNHVILVAPMQSGKTSTCISVVNIINKSKLNLNMHIRRVLFISGMNDCGLKDQTSVRVKNQVIGIDDDEIVIGCPKNVSYKAKYFIMKNSDLMRYTDSLDNTLVFIDESHFGSNENNVLTKFMAEHKVDWKNTMDLIRRNIYIVSVSATPFCEMVSDTVDTKKIVQLKTDAAYFGVSDFLDQDVVFNANKDDVETGGAIFDYIMDAKYRMDDNNEAGVIFIRTRKFDIIKNDSFVASNFDIFEMDSASSRIEYKVLNEKLNRLMRHNQAPIGSNQVKPLIVLIKGAFRAGMTIDARHKDFVYMVYDYSNNADTTAQALLGRMCGYRHDKDTVGKTFFYIKKQFADMYSDWSKDFTNRNLIPCSRTKWAWVDGECPNGDVKLGSRPCGNFAVNLTDDEVLQFYNLRATRDKKHAKAQALIDNMLTKHNLTIQYDYVGEVQVNGKNNYAKSSQSKRFDSFSKDSLVFQFRPEKMPQFVADTGRNFLDQTDVGKKCISIVLDANVDGGHISGNKRLLVYYVEVGQKHRVFVRESQYQAHKGTRLLAK